MTITPITQGFGGKNCEGGKYFKYYGPFFATEKNFRTEFGRTLTGCEVEQIDLHIDAFNTFIKGEVKRRNKVKERENWHIVDICSLLDLLAIKRKANFKINLAEEQAKEVLENFFAEKKRFKPPTALL